VVLAVNLEHWFEAPDYPWTGRNHRERCDDTQTSVDQNRLEVEDLPSVG
jgi:hypothetical protein